MLGYVLAFLGLMGMIYLIVEETRRLIQGKEWKPLFSDIIERWRKQSKKGGS